MYIHVPSKVWSVAVEDLLSGGYFFDGSDNEAATIEAVYHRRITGVIHHASTRIYGAGDSVLVVAHDKAAATATNTGATGKRATNGIIAIIAAYVWRLLRSDCFP